tara:strand:- start:460 stop:987 length:528 start_codon:yes stop_codon:yes gene_type:complete
MVHFYLINNKQLLVTNYEQERVKKKYGFKLELLQSCRDISTIDHTKNNIKKSYKIEEEYEWFKRRVNFTAEVRKKISLALKGKKRPIEVRRKISESKKGKSNFEGKKHSRETKRKMALAKYGNNNNEGKHWVYNPITNVEKLVDKSFNLGTEWRRGRDPYLIENLLYHSPLTKKS